MKKRIQYGLAVLVWFAFAAPAWSGNFVAHLDQKETVPPAAVETNAQGQAIIKERGGDLSFKILVAGLQNVVAAHIHCAPIGFPGQIGVTLFLTGWVLTLSGFQPNVEQTETAKLALLSLYALYPLVCYLIGTVIFMRFGLDEKEHTRIRHELDRRAAEAGQS